MQYATLRRKRIYRILYVDNSAQDCITQSSAIYLIYVKCTFGTTLLMFKLVIKIHSGGSNGVTAVFVT